MEKLRSFIENEKIDFIELKIHRSSIIIDPTLVRRKTLIYLILASALIYISFNEDFDFYFELFLIVYFVYLILFWTYLDTLNVLLIHIDKQEIHIRSKNILKRAFKWIFRRQIVIQFSSTKTIVCKEEFRGDINDRYVQLILENKDGKEFKLFPVRTMEDAAKLRNFLCSVIYG